MPRQNRVTPLGELVATPERGLVFGNRGCLHDAEGRIRRSFSGRRWIACKLDFRNRRRFPLLQPGRYTELFFLDDATALTAGHRPCAECRREDYASFTQAWRALHPNDVGADAVDARLHGERLVTPTRERLHHDAPLHDVPDGVFVLRDEEPWLVAGDGLHRWTPAGYMERRARPTRGGAPVLTPRSVVCVLRSGWRPATVPFLHPSATDRPTLSV